jgi:hypothetical protein
LVQKVLFSPPDGSYVVGVIGRLRALVASEASNNWETSVPYGSRQTNKQSKFLTPSPHRATRSCNLNTFVQKGFMTCDKPEIKIRSLLSSGMLRRVALVRTDVSEERIASIISSSQRASVPSYC